MTDENGNEIIYTTQYVPWNELKVPFPWEAFLIIGLVALLMGKR